ncbi:GNAT family N-acetyltransferase [Actinomarinicola tropica]|uniref:GNAT family N-acetyltransferase n=1 Tax=Actinomarinicola tropica TaxID=2789776 RepID=UPI001E3ECC43|nr:GNAT family N-acetyltransferase [Actinomarinicola tropica]
MPSPEDLAVVEGGLVASWSRQVRWTGGDAHRVGGLFVALSGVPDQTQQVAVIEGALDDPDAALAAAEVLFGRRRWQPAVDVVAGAHPELEDALRGRGYRVAVRRPAMVLREGDPVTTEAPSTEVRRAAPADRRAVVVAQCEAFGVSRRLAEQMVPPDAFDDPGVEVLVALGHRSRVVGSVTVHVDGPIAGIVGAGVMRRHRRQGAGTALTLGALESAVRRGAHGVWLQATADGEGVYRRCGFRPVGTCEVWLGPTPR